ncbi:MAG: hypothetical protein HQM10_11950 [Candidatus Riflebacteria bacterium]|nr:hypothetical protein [Candidatus Riflebacteria bacterium]
MTRTWKHSYNVYLVVIIFLLKVGWLLFSEKISPDPQPGFPLDDSWIHAALARNIACGEGFTINPGEPAAGSTSVLWTFVLAGIHYLCGSENTNSVILCARFLNCLFMVITIVFSLRIMRTFTLNNIYLFAGGILFITSYPWAWSCMSGMEMPLASMLIMIVFYIQFFGSVQSSDHFLPQTALCRHHSANDALRTDFEKSSQNTIPDVINVPRKIFVSSIAENVLIPVVWFIAFLARPEMLIVALVSLVIISPVSKYCRSVIQVDMPGASEADSSAFSIRDMFVQVSIFLFCLVIFFVLYHNYFGVFMPNTLEAKMTERAFPLAFKTSGIFHALKTAFLSPFIDLFSVFSFLFFFNPVSCIVFIAFYVTYIIKLSGKLKTFYLQLLNNSEKSKSVKCVLIELEKSDSLIKVFWGGAILLFVSAATGIIAGPENYAFQHGRYFSPFFCISFSIAAGFFLKHLPVDLLKNHFILLLLLSGVLIAAEAQYQSGPEFAAEVYNINQLQVKAAKKISAVVKKDAAIGVNDVGAMAYFTENRIIDLEGLMDPALIPFKRAGKTGEYVRKSKIPFVLIFPYWYPDIASDKNFKPIWKVSVERNVTGGGDELVLYSTEY